MQVVLVTYRPKGQRVNIPLESKSVLIGRSPKCTVRIPSGNVSRQHCELIIEKDRIWVKDLGAANGTFLNGDKVKLVRALPGDIISVGGIYFGIQVDGDPEDFPHIRPVGSKLAAGLAAVKDSWPASGAGENDEDDSDGMSEDMIAAMLGDDDDDDDAPVSLNGRGKGPAAKPPADGDEEPAE